MAAATEPCRVLVVDDQDAFRAAAAAVVAETAGFEMCGESDSCSGVQGLVEQLSPDVVLLDVRMPDADSLDVATVLRRERPEVVVVLVSAFSRDDVPAEVLGPVSYTHLDVYKRQPLHRCARFTRVSTAIDSPRLG